MSGLERWFEGLDDARMAEWVASRPAGVRRLLARFPIGTTLQLRGAAWFVIGATEGGALIIAPAWSEAMENKQYVCGECQRRGVLDWVVPHD